MLAPKSWLQCPIVAPPITWQATPIGALPSWAAARRVCVDVECQDESLSELGPGVRRGGFVCGIAFAIEDGPAHYLPIRHEGGGNLPESAVWQYLRDQAAAFTGDVVFNSAPYDLDYLWENKVEFRRARFHRDVQVGAPLLNELEKTYGLDAIAARLGLPGKDETELRAHADAWGVHPKHGMWRLHAGAVGRYGEQDVRLPLQALRRLERDIEEQELQAIYDLESRVTLALVRMTRRGLRVDVDEMERVATWAQGRLQECIDQIHHLTGVRVGSLSNAAELYPALKQRGLLVPTPIHGGTGKPTPSITKLWLQQQDDDVARTIIVGREFVKLLGTYVAGFRKHMVGERIYPSFKQLYGASDDDADDGDGVRGGRVAAKHPNVHAQMKRSKEIKKRWRKVLIADHGMRLYRADISKQEPRLTIHYAEACRLPGARAAGDAFRANPKLDPYTQMLRLIGWDDERYDDIKPIYLGKCYGMGGGKLAKSLKLPTVVKHSPQFGDYDAAGPEAQALIDQFDRGVPYVRALAKLCTRQARARKYLRTIGGRHVHFELDSDGNIMEEHKGLNKLIQNSAADQTKAALVALDDAGYPLQLTVHDEFDYSGDDDRMGWEMGEIVKSVLTLSVPSVVDLEVGESYGSMQPLVLT
jgi:DNA polymerase I-like protein with 3'-5' exonuclease and polymerase domains